MVEHARLTNQSRGLFVSRIDRLIPCSDSIINVFLTHFMSVDYKLNHELVVRLLVNVIFLYYTFGNKKRSVLQKKKSIRILL